jgi:hypothetical protein
VNFGKFEQGIIYFKFTFIVYHKLSVVEVVLDLMWAIWRKVIGFRIISSRKYIIFMQFFWFFVS